MEKNFCMVHHLRKRNLKFDDVVRLQKFRFKNYCVQSEELNTV